MGRVVRLDEKVLVRIVRQVLEETSACLGASYGSVSRLAHEVKSGDRDAIDQAALIMKRYVPPRSVLVPIPNHGGRAEYTLALAERIASLSRSSVADVLKMQKRDVSWYLMKKRGMTAGSEPSGIVAEWDEDTAELMDKARNVILVDNVIDSGRTYENARKAIQDVYGVDAWLLTLGAVKYPKDRSMDVIRSEYPRDGRGFYEGKRR